MSTELEKLDKELELVEQEIAQHPQETLMGLAEAVTLVNRDTKQASEQISKAAEDLQQAPEKITKRVDETIRGAIEKISHIENEARERLSQAEQDSAVTRKKSRTWGLWFLSLSVIGGLLWIGASYWLVNGAEKRLSTLELESVKLGGKIDSEQIRTLYGARLERNGNGNFIIFNEDIKTGTCNVENCVSIEKTDNIK